MPLNARIILFVSHEINMPRKGFRFLAEALAGMSATEEVFLLSLGIGTPPELQRFPHAHIPLVSDDGLLHLFIVQRMYL